MTKRPSLRDTQKVGRLAMRQEGDTWIAYYALNDTMEGAVFLGAIKMRFVSGPEGSARKARFMALMRDGVGDLIEESTGVRPVWGKTQAAPEDERSGTA